jgi:dynein heavy chain
MPLEEGCSGFITMNPGYIGRAELPESLKALFRPITVMVPDRQLIMENMLMAEGFVEAKMLAKKFASLYYLLEDMLSPQTHYDWGLRAIKSVLVVAGSLLRAEEGQDESDVLFRALRDFNIPKILAADMVIFMGLLGDLFIGVDPPRKRDMEFEKVIEQCTEEMGLTVEDDFTLRIVQLSELLAIRHCIFLMGVTGGGRTEVYRVLAKAIQKGVNLPENQIVNDYLRSCNKSKVVIRDINPKSISTQEFYGYVNMSTREWKDGMMSYYMRELATIPDEDPKWIILDGDLDANWIESMNSTMDDNRLLTLPSNERIRLLPHMKLIFEIRNLKFATPATATRAGIVYVSEKLQWYNMIQSWIKRVVPEYAVKAKWKNPELPSKYILELVDKYVPKTIFEMKKSFQHITPLETMNFCTTLVNILEGMLRPENLNAKADQAAFESYFVLAMVWAFGGGLAPKDGIDYRKDFDKWWKRTWSAVKFPGKGSVFDYYINAKSGKFAPWADLVPEVEFDSQVTAMSSLFVPTPETSSFTYFLDMMLELRAPIMFVGPAGTGKTALVKGKLAAQPEGIMSLNINFNYFTDVLSFQKILESQLEKKAGVNYGPPGQNKLIYFVDDLNMPKLDAYDTAMPISQIRQHLGWGHWFDRQKLTPKVIHNTQYVACMNPTAGAFTINPRLQRLFMTLAVDFPGQDSLMKIYGTFMTGHLKHFSSDCQELGSKLIQASLANHEKVVASFRKTAVNFHYEFTVRHLSNVFQGLLSSTPDNFNDVNKLSKLWLHESERVYADRLVTVNDLNTYNKNAQAIAGKFFKIPGIEDFYKKDDAKPLIFCHFAGGIEEKVYNDINEFSKLQKILEDTLEEYNETNARMDLVLFEDAMKHICRISRIISNPGGHALLVGVGGSGKQSLSKLSAHLCGMSTYMIVISGSYNISSLREDLQKMYKSAGLKGEGVLWLFTDSQITDEKFMVFINDLLSSGEIPDLFPPEDVDDIINAVRGEAKAAGLPDSREAVWKFFIDKVRTNLHMVFTCSPVGEQFRTRAQRFLAMINSTVIDWFQPWPEKALLGVSQRFLGETDLGSSDVGAAVMRFMPFTFSLVAKMSEKFLEQERRFNYTTPKTFLELIKLYKSLLLDKRGATETNIDRLSNGLDKLMKTQKDVDVLVEQAKVKAVEVAEKVESAGAFAAKVDVEKAAASVENDAAQVEADKCAVIATEVAAKQVSVQADLDAAEPLVDQALAALDTLNKKDLGEAKSLKKPPAGVDDITAVIIILLQNNPKDKSWNAATKMMSNVDKFMETLKGFKQKIDDGEVPKKSVDACRPYLELEHFNRDAIYNKSRAAAGLCEFAINIIKYFDVITMIEPKRQELAEANAQLDEANTKLAAVQEKVANLNALVADLERQFNEAEAEKNGAIEEKEKLDIKLGLANRLVNALAASGEQWKNTVAQLKIDAGVLVGDCLFAAAFVTYSGPFTAQFRNELVSAFQKNIAENGIPMTEGIDVLKVLVDAATIAGWVGEGLPSDRTSIENGTITCNSERWPLMCDPQLQGIAWIKEREAKNNLQVVRMGAPKTADIMEKAIENGTSVLIENMGESIDAVLMPTVTRATYKKGRSLYVKMGDKDVEYHPNFKLFLHTKMSNPHYPPEIQAETTLINFTVTQDGLEDQLLALVVNKERPDLEETKTALIVQNNEFTIKLKELEDTLLAKLADAEGDLTEDVVLIESLEESKRVADEIVVKVAESKETEEKINKSREKYRVAAARGSLLFFMLNSLNKGARVLRLFAQRLCHRVCARHRPRARRQEAQGEALVPHGGEARDGQVRLEHGPARAAHALQKIRRRRRRAQGGDARAHRGGDGEATQRAARDDDVHGVQLHATRFVRQGQAHRLDAAHVFHLAQGRQAERDGV